MNSLIMKGGTIKRKPLCKLKGWEKWIERKKG